MSADSKLKLAVVGLGLAAGFVGLLTVVYFIRTRPGREGGIPIYPLDPEDPDEEGGDSVTVIPAETDEVTQPLPISQPDASTQPVGGMMALAALLSDDPTPADPTADDAAPADAAPADAAPADAAPADAAPADAKEDGAIADDATGGEEDASETNKGAGQNDLVSTTDPEQEPPADEASSAGEGKDTVDE